MNPEACLAGDPHGFPGREARAAGGPGAALKLAVLLSALLFALVGCRSSGSTETADAGSAQAGSGAKQSQGATRSPAPTRSPSKSAGTNQAAGQDLAPSNPTTNLRTVPVSQLPKEAKQTLVLIRDGGPFPYSKDGATFSNREGILPKRPSGFYQEYTVITPGSPDRGARRIVAGENGSRFYTSDHYDSFREVVSG